MSHVSVVLESGATVAGKCWPKGENYRSSTRKRVIALHGWLDSASTFNLIAQDIVEQANTIILAPEFMVRFFKKFTSLIVDLGTWKIESFKSENWTSILFP